MPPSRARRVLVCATGGLGNTVLLLPLLRTLRRGCPEARLDLLLTGGAAADLARTLGWADSVLVLPEAEWYRGASILKYFAGPIRRAGYDWVLRTFLTAPAMARASLAAYLCGAPTRVAYGVSAANPFETHLLSDDDRRPEMERHLALAETLGLTADRSWRPIAATAEGRAWADRFLAENGAGSGQPVVGFHPGSDPRFLAKRWPAENFGELAQRVAQHLGAKGVILGGPDDQPAVEATVRSAGPAAFPALGQGMAETLGLIERCAAFVTNDSGLMHAASALGVPTLALFGPTDPIKNRPLDPGTRILRLGLECSPCTKQHAIQVCDHHDCLMKLSVPMVYAALERLWSERAARNPTGSVGPAGEGTACVG